MKPSENRQKKAMSIYEIKRGDAFDSWNVLRHGRVIQTLFGLSDQQAADHLKKVRETNERVSK